MNASLSGATFAYGPYFALFGFLAALMYRWGILRNSTGAPVAGVGAPAEGALCLGFTVLVGGHAVTAIAPGAMRVLLADLDRVAVIEAVGLVGAMLFAFGVAARLRRRLQAWRAGTPGQGVRVLVLALLLAVCCSGIYLTVSLRWITAWYAYISVPYVRSLLALDPVVDAVVASPFAVKLHMVLFMAFLACWPLGGLGMDEIFPLRAVARRVGGVPAGGAEGAP